MALAGTTDGPTDFEYHTVGQSTYYLDGLRQRQRVLQILRPINSLRAYKDGDLTFAVRAGCFSNGHTVVEFPGAQGQSLADNQINYIYLTPTGVLTVNTTGFPDPLACPHMPLASIVTADETYVHTDITDYRDRAMMQVIGGPGLEANTAGAASPNVLTAAESRKILTNQGATELNYHTLPAAAAGLIFTFLVRDADGIRITVSGGDTIELDGVVSVAGGYVESVSVGDRVTLLAINDTEWVDAALRGVWTVETA